MASNASRGAAAKGRTKKWLAAQGYHVADLEVVRWVFTAHGRVPVKRDQFASDLLAMSATEIVFVQVKRGAAAIGGTFPAARRAFAAFAFPPAVRCLVVGWPPRARAPRVIDVRQGAAAQRGIDLQCGERPAIPPVDAREAVFAERRRASAVRHKERPHGQEEGEGAQDATEAVRRRERPDAGDEGTTDAHAHARPAVAAAPRHGAGPRSKTRQHL